MMKNIIKTVAIAAAFMLLSVGAEAQMKTAYFMEGSTMRLEMNPSLTPTRGYVNIPVIGQFNVGAYSNFMSVNKLLYKNPNGSGLVTFMHQSISTDDFMKKIHQHNFMQLDGRFNLFGAGDYTKDLFWSFNVDMRVNGGIDLPKDLFRALKNLNMGSYDMGDMSADVDVYTEVGVGFNIPVHEYVDFGFRAKFLIGLAQLSADIDKMDLTLSDDIYVAKMRGTLRGNVAGFGFGSLVGPIKFNQIISQVTSMNNFSMSNINSFGVAFDLGASARLLDNRLKVSVGVNDLGFIYWGKSSGFNSSDIDLYAAYTGIDLDSSKVQIDENFSDFDLTLDKPESYCKMVRATVNIGAEYAFLQNRIGVGLLSQTRFLGGRTSSELTLSANFRPLSWLSLSLSHSLIETQLGVVGFALNMHPRAINFFIGMDYLAFEFGQASLGSSRAVLPVRQSSVNFYFGLAVPLHSQSRMVRPN